MKRLVLALAALGALALVPAGQARVAAKPKADLVITQVFVRELPGKPSFIPVDHNDKAPKFIVKVTTKNIGGAPARWTTTRMWVDNNLETVLHRDAQYVGPLTPGMYRRSTFTVTGLEPHLGFVTIAAYADSTSRVREAKEKNNSGAGPRIYVVARTWKAVQFQTRTVLNAGIPQTSFTATPTTGFTFKLVPAVSSQGLFQYDAQGPIRAGFDETGACTAHGEDTKTKDWGGYLDLWAKLTMYSAFVPASREPDEIVPLYCEGVFVGNENWKWQDLKTARPPGALLYEMDDDQTQIQDHFEQAAPTGGQTTWDWTFQADVVYSHRSSVSLGPH